MEQRQAEKESSCSPLASNNLFDAAQQWDADKAVIKSHLEAIEELNKRVRQQMYFIHERLRERPDLKDWFENIIFED